MTRPRRRDAGISNWFVLPLVFLTVALVFASFIYYGRYDEVRRQQKALKDEKVRLENQEAELKARNTACIPPTGMVNKSGEELPIEGAARHSKKTRDEYFTEKWFDKLPMDKPQATTDPRRFAQMKEEGNLFELIEHQLRLAASRLQLYKDHAELLTLEQGLAQTAATNTVNVRPEIMKPKQEKIGVLETQIARTISSISEENTTYEERKRVLLDARTKAEAELAEEVARYAEFEIKIQNEIRELRRQLEELKVKEVIKHDAIFVHGKVLRPDVPNRIAYIDIGSRDRVVTGLKFLVGKPGNQGKFDFKGKIEVKKAWPSYSEVAIIEIKDAKNRPIIDGDLLINPLFSRDRPLIVTFAGEERPARLRYSTDEAARRIREIGSEVRKDLTLDIDYVIFTECASQRQRENYDVYKKAVFLEVPVAEASELYNYLGD